MPSAEEPTHLIKMIPDTTQDFLSRDVDLLVSQIKENLKLSNLKAKSSISQKNRPSPYRIPSRSWSDPTSSCEICGKNSSHERHHNRHRKMSTRDQEDDPYELLQELLRDGGLIKEAVKRLQDNFDDFNNSTVDTSDEEDNEEDSNLSQGRRTAWFYQRRIQRKPYFYDSEDEILSPVHQSIEM